MVTTGGGGTLFLNDIDQLDYQLQNQLSALIRMVSTQWLSPSSAEGKPAVRIIAATNQDLSVLVSENKFSRHLHAELDFLQIFIPPLRERKQDAGIFIHYFLNKHRQYDEQFFSADAFDILQEYKWPGNAIEIEHVVARLIVRSGKREIQFKDIEYITPFILDGVNNDTIMPKDEKRSVDVEYMDSLSESGTQEPPIAVMDDLHKKVLSCSLDFLDSHHPCLRKALKYISGNYQNEITLAELAEVACVSPSHLCFLFRTELSTTFKSLLGMIRIEKAKILLLEKPDIPITVVSLEVGFRDLSHFERTFRRLVDLNPRDYRRRNRKNSAIHELSYLSLK